MRSLSLAHIALSPSQPSSDNVPNHTLALLFMMTFCVMQPLVTLAAMAYFAATSFVARYQLLYMFREKYQAGGRFFPVVRGGRGEAGVLLP